MRRRQVHPRDKAAGAVRAAAPSSAAASPLAPSSAHPHAAGLSAATPPVDSLQRGLEVLRCFRPGEDALEAAEVASRLALPAATARRLLETLEAQGFLLRAEGSTRFGLHVACLVLGQAVVGSSALARSAQPLLHLFSERFGGSGIACVHERDHMLMLAHAAADTAGLHGAGGTRALGVGMQVPVATSAFGHAWLWTQDAQVQALWLARLREGAQAAGNAPALYRAFHELEAHGVCQVSEPARRDIVTFAAPLTLHDGSVAVIGCVREGPLAEGMPSHNECATALAALAGTLRDEVMRRS
jgi:DNA-binding IclR family transcriptional regulator